MLLDVQRGQLNFTKGCIIAVILLSLSWTLNRGQLSLERFNFGSQLHSFWRWTCVCVMLLRKMYFKQNCLKIIAKQ
ncbi:DUF645 family protein [Vibrio cholerae]|uniref:DUF645 family protein n=1 Tax=Vibrio cholerae TaxID=666 RepID=UPI00359C3C6A